MNIVVLAGGISTERDVSLVSGRQVYNALLKNGHNVIFLDVYLGYELEKDEEAAGLEALFKANKDTTKGLEVNKYGGIIVNEDGLTSKTGVYAGGDAVTGAATVITAMGAGKTAAKAIDEYIKSK